MSLLLSACCLELNSVHSRVDWDGQVNVGIVFWDNCEDCKPVKNWDVDGVLASATSEPSARLPSMLSCKLSSCFSPPPCIDLTFSLSLTQFLLVCLGLFLGELFLCGLLLGLCNFSIFIGTIDQLICRGLLLWPCIFSSDKDLFSVCGWFVSIHDGSISVVRYE